MGPAMRGRRGVALPLGRPVPAAEPGVCRLCHGAARDRPGPVLVLPGCLRALGDDCGDHPTVPAALHGRRSPPHRAPGLQGCRGGRRPAPLRPGGSPRTWNGVFGGARRMRRARSGPMGRRGGRAVVGPARHRRRLRPRRPVWARHPLTAVIDDVGVLSGIHRVENSAGAPGRWATWHRNATPSWRPRRRAAGAFSCSTTRGSRGRGWPARRRPSSWRAPPWSPRWWRAGPVRAPVPPSPGGGVGTSRGCDGGVGEHDGGAVLPLALPRSAALALLRTGRSAAERSAPPTG